MRLNPLAVPSVILAVVLFWLGTSLEKKIVSPVVRRCLFLFSLAVAVPGLLFALYYTHLFDNAAWFYRFRALPYTELAVGGIGLLAGVVNSWFAPESFGERLALPTAVAAILAIPFVKPLLDPLDLSRLRDRCDGEVCMQSTFSTCGPSSAATILKVLGQPASERVLARESLTSRGGTEVWYIARAFERRGFRARVVIQRVGEMSTPSPAIAGVVLPGGAGHFIAVMGQTADEVTLGDPMKGKLVVKKSDLSSAYHFTGFFLKIDPR